MNLIHFNHFEEELINFQYVHGTIKRTLLVRARSEILLEIYIVTAVPIFAMWIGMERTETVQIMLLLDIAVLEQTMSVRNRIYKTS
jgi:uncharacterized membrane protein